MKFRDILADALAYLERKTRGNMEQMSTELMSTEQIHQREFKARLDDSATEVKLDKLPTREEIQNGIDGVPSETLSTMHQVIGEEISRREADESRKVADARAAQDKADAEETAEKRVADHDPHGPWKRGMLPGSKYIRTCQECGFWEEVSYDEWTKYA